MAASDNFNIAEIFIWSGFGIAFAILSFRSPPENRTRRIVLAVAFFAFSVSDYVEIQTGAWWEPWWLLLWKAICIGVFVEAMIHRSRSRRQ
jgi:hypothetical protein